MNPPANWYPDPTGRHGQRYWDGAQWTEHVFTDGVQSVDRLEAATAPADTADTDTGGDTPGGEAATTDATTEEPAPLPRRQPRGPASDETPADAQADEPIRGAEGLFSAAADTGGDESDEFDDADDAPPGLFSAADDEHQTEPAPTATDQADESEPATETWTPDEVEPEDDGAVAPEVEPDDVVASVEEAAATADFSDAFVLAPETASRLVGRNARTADDEAGEDDDVDAGAPPEVATEVEPEAPDGTPDDEPVIDAPPPTMPPPATPATTGTTGLGITGDLVGGAFAEREGDGPITLQNSRMLRCDASQGIVARQGTMVAYQGDVSFERQGAGGVGRALKRAATGEGLAMMRVTGSGDVFFADGAQHVFLLELDGGPGLSVNGRNILAFSSSLTWDIERVKGATLIAGGLFNTTLTGRGWVALVSDGEPVVLRTDGAPTHVDVNALVAWSGGLATRITNTVSAKSLVGLGSGEAFQMAFEGSGVVIVQPSEGRTGGASAT